MGNHPTLQASLMPQLNALIAVAKKLEYDGAFDSAEMLYRKAVSTSELFYGSSSPRTGLAVLELMTFCEKHKNDTEAADLWKRLRAIVSESPNNSQILAK